MDPNSVFVDTGAWFAAAVTGDPDHEKARALFASNTRPLLTTDYIIDKLLTLFVVRGHKHKAKRWLRKVLWNGGVDVEHINQSDFDEAIKIFDDFNDKEWSLTDCTSYVVMRRLGVTSAYSFDAHFQQFGFVHVIS